MSFLRFFKSGKTRFLRFSDVLDVFLRFFRREKTRFGAAKSLPLHRSTVGDVEARLRRRTFRSRRSPCVDVRAAEVGAATPL
jgi:hypothetical protein